MESRGEDHRDTPRCQDGLDGLRGLADRDRRGIVTVTHLAAWMGPRVTRDSEGRQHPQYSALDGEGDFVFVLPGR